MAFGSGSGSGSKYSVVTVPPNLEGYEDLHGLELTDPAVPESLLRSMLKWRKEKYVVGAQQALAQRAELDAAENAYTRVPMALWKQVVAYAKTQTEG